MAWSVAQKKDRDDLKAFLSIDEWGHVAFTSRLSDEKKSLLIPPEKGKILINRLSGSGNRITEAILYTSSGVIIPVLAGGSESQRAAPDRLFSRVGSIYSVMGRKRDVEAVQRILTSRSYATIDYHLMSLEEKPECSVTGERITIKKGKPRDVSLLFPLQKAYEIEEVLLNPANFSSRNCYLALQRNLRNEIIYYGLLDGKAVAKAGTNARGFTFSQLGGIYTGEEFRNRGIGEYLLCHLLNRILKSGRGASLFVKKENISAIGLYRKLKFKVRDEYRIAYYR
jgi:uncharacterized protein